MEANQCCKELGLQSNNQWKQYFVSNVWEANGKTISVDNTYNICIYITH